MATSTTSPRSINNKTYDSTTGKVDFLSSYMKFTDRESVALIANITMTEELVGRMDLILQRFYGSTDDMDVFLAFNRIDDMFAVPVGRQILVPDKFAMLAAVSFVSTETSYSLDNNKSVNPFTDEDVTYDDSETVANNRSKLQDRGPGYEIVSPGVIKF